MPPLTEQDRLELIRLLQACEQIPAHWRGKLFPGGPQSVEIGKEYRLEYAGKMKREQVLAETPAAPWQLVRRFAEERPHGDGWRNLLVWGDNLLALREHLADQQGPNRFSTTEDQAHLHRSSLYHPSRLHEGQGETVSLLLSNKEGCLITLKGLF